MKNIILFLFLTSTIYTFSQKKNNKFKQPFPVFESCIKSVTPNECFNSIMISKMIPAIESDVKNYLKEKKCEYIFVSVYFVIDQDGKPISESISTSKIKNNPSIEIKLKKVISNLPKIYPRKNEYNNAILTYYHLTLSLGLDENENIIVLEDTNEPKAFSENKNFTAPIYPKCKSTSNKELQKCFSNQMTKLIVKKYNYKKATKGFNKKGSFYTYILFKVDKKGEVNNYKVFAPNEKFKKEALRSLRKIKDLKPGTHNKKPVNVNFAIPIKLKLE